MKLTQEDKETIYNNYISFIDELSDDLDHKSEISPKEIVYAVVGLVEDHVNKDVARVYTGTGSDYLDCVLGVGGFEQYGPIDK